MLWNSFCDCWHLQSKWPANHVPYSQSTGQDSDCLQSKTVHLVKSNLQTNLQFLMNPAMEDRLSEIMSCTLKNRWDFWRFSHCVKWSYKFCPTKLQLSFRTGWETLVEIKFLHFPTSFVWNVGWSLHICHGQHIRCHYLSAIRMGSGSSRNWPVHLVGLLYRYTLRLWLTKHIDCTNDGLFIVFQLVLFLSQCSLQSVFVKDAKLKVGVCTFYSVMSSVRE